jgi:hypothetical protein
MAVVDGFNSSLGPYGGGNVHSEATLSINSLGDENVCIYGGTVQGTVFIMPEANFDTVVKIANGGSVQGGTRRLSIEAPLPVPGEPGNMPGSVGNKTFSTGVEELDSDRRYNRLTLTGDVALRITAPVRILCDDEVLIEQNARIVVEPGAHLLMCTKKLVRITDTAQVNVDSADPARLNWLALTNSIRLANDAQMYAKVQGYDGVLAVTGGAHFYGTFLGKRATVRNSGRLHVDTAHSGTPATLGGGIDLKMIARSDVRWMESP